MTDQHARTPVPRPYEGHGGHGWLMVACCIPMLLIAVALVATGVASAGLVVAAIGCTVMMALMMRGMDSPAGGQGGGDHVDRDRSGPR